MKLNIMNNGTNDYIVIRRSWIYV